MPPTAGAPNAWWIVEIVDIELNYAANVHAEIFVGRLKLQAFVPRGGEIQVCAHFISLRRLFIECSVVSIQTFFHRRHTPFECQKNLMMPLNFQRNLWYGCRQHRGNLF